jgi:multicomponent Na+:H+ antiporter subunit A
MLAGPLLLAALGVVFGLQPDWIEPLVRPATSAVLGAPAKADLYLFKEVNDAFILSLVTFAAGFLLYALRGRLRDALSGVPPRFDPGWDRTMGWVAAGSAGLTGAIQTGRLRGYIFATFASLAAVVLFALWRGGVWPALPPMGDVAAAHWAVLIFVTVGAVLASITNSRMTAIAALGIVGIGVALIFIMFGAPDVAITQLLVEMLQVVLVAVAMLKLPHLDRVRVSTIRVWDLLLAISIGGIVTVILMSVMATPLDLRLTEYFEATSAPLAFGRNIVNVILVDFRALDTFGEIAVVMIAALGAFALLRSTRRDAP